MYPSACKHLLLLCFRFFHILVFSLSDISSWVIFLPKREYMIKEKEGEKDKLVIYVGWRWIHHSDSFSECTSPIPQRGTRQTLKHGYGNVLEGPPPSHLLMLSEFRKWENTYLRQWFNFVSVSPPPQGSLTDGGTWYNSSLPWWYFMLCMIPCHGELLILISTQSNYEVKLKDLPILPSSYSW